MKKRDKEEREKWIKREKVNLNYRESVLMVEYAVITFNHVITRLRKWDRIKKYIYVEREMNKNDL